jgi:glutathione peroxidase
MSGCVLCKIGVASMVAVAALAGVGMMAGADDKPADAKPAEKTVEAKPADSKPADAKPAAEVPAEKPSPYVLNYTLKDIEGKDVDLSTFKGKVVMIVNVASKCGMTPQYEGLQKLWEEKKDSGLVILGFPANNFGGQEPGSDEQIKQFCTTNYKVTFPMFSKISVKDDKTNGDAHPLFKQLASQPAPIGGAPEWNFTKYLVDKNGNVVEKFPFRTPPSDPALRRRIDELLAAK